MELLTEEETRRTKQRLATTNEAASLILSSVYTLLHELYGCDHKDFGPLGEEIQKFEKLFLKFLNENVSSPKSALAAGIVAVSIAYTLARANSEATTGDLIDLEEAYRNSGSKLVN